ncbi:MAG: DUF4372 domain-containing protein [Bdellovibrionota bacterium]
MAQPTVFSQLIKLIPRTEFESIVARHDGDANRTRPTEVLRIFMRIF